VIPAENIFIVTNDIYADLVTEMKEIKHYYNQGVPAREGIEF
jgi:ATP:corrinoid adenosyltransferase